MAAEHKPRVFLDSSVIFSALYTGQGAAGALLEQFIHGKIEVVVSQQVLDEVISTVNKKWPDALPALGRLLMSCPPEVAASPPPEKVQVWQGKLTAADASILEAAFTAKPDYFITSDTHFLTNLGATVQSVLRIVTPAQFVNSK